MTENEKIELRDLRVMSQKLEREINNLQNEIDDNIYALNNLEKWKKGRGVGFYALLIIFALFILLMFKQLNIWSESNAGRGLSLNSTVVYALATSSNIFEFILLLALAVCTILSGLKFMMEMGKSKSSQALARAMGKRNYYTVYNELYPKSASLQKEMFNLTSQKQEIDKRLKVLETIETPWNA